MALRPLTREFTIGRRAGRGFSVPSIDVLEFRVLVEGVRTEPPAVAGLREASVGRGDPDRPVGVDRQRAGPTAPGRPGAVPRGHPMGVIVSEEAALDRCSTVIRGPISVVSSMGSWCCTIAWPDVAESDVRRTRLLIFAGPVCNGADPTIPGAQPDHEGSLRRGRLVGEWRFQ